MVNLRQFIIRLNFGVFLACTWFAAINAQNTLPGSDRLKLEDTSGIMLSGPAEFLEVNGIKGFHPTSIHTRASFKTEIPAQERGTISVWFSPLEDLNYGKRPGAMDKELYFYPLLSVADPPFKLNDADFGIYWNEGYPPLVGKFTEGFFWDIVNYRFAPFVYAERVPLKRGQWYHLVMTWDKPAEKIEMYLNGILVGYNHTAWDFSLPSERIFLGNPMMVLHGLEMKPQWTVPEQAAALYRNGRPDGNDLADEEVLLENSPRYFPDIDIPLDENWVKSYECSFLKPDDLKGWIPQTGDMFRERFRVELTSEGLLFQTPDTIHRQSRMYLWCPELFEGDIRIEYDFRLESPEGLALLIVFASGVQREDIISDYGLARSGSMIEMLSKYRNYHWEYMRRVCLNRTDMETQYVQKNPVRNLYMGNIHPLAQDVWHHLVFIKQGNRLCGSIDGKTVFNIKDDPHAGGGASYAFGRIGLRQMFYTRMRYRKLVVYTSNRIE